MSRIHLTKSNIIVTVLNTVLCAAIIAVTATVLDGWSVLVRSVCIAAGGIGIVLGIVMLLLDKPAILKSVFVLACCASVVILALALLSAFGKLDEYPTDGEKITHVTDLIRASGSWGMVVFVVLQILQVVILPLPAAVCYIPGSVIWGPLYATLLASLGVIIGSLVCYAIGKFLGKRVVAWIAGSDVDKYISMLGKRGKLLFLLMQILPFFPDDILCMVAGLTSMNFPFFIITISVVRPFIIAAYCYLGSGTVIPFSGWGIPVWIIIFVVCVVLAVLSFKYQDRFEAWLVSKLSRKKRSNKADGKVVETIDDGADNAEENIEADKTNEQPDENADGA